MRSIRVKMVVMYLTLVFIVMVAVGTFTVIWLNRMEEQKVEVWLSDRADRIRDQIINDIDAGEEWFNFQHALQNFGWTSDLSPIEYYILDRYGTVLATSVEEIPLLIQAESILTSAVSAVMSGAPGTYHFRAGGVYPNREGRDITWMEYSRNVISRRTGETFILYLRISAQETNESVRAMILTFFLGLMIAFVLAIILGTIFAGSVNKPIRILTNKAREFAQGALDQDIVVYSNDEIGQLADSFNNMSHDLKLTLEGLENEKNQKEVVLHNVTDGVLAYDLGGKLIHANHVCRDLLGITGLEYISFQQMLKHLGIAGETLRNQTLTEIVLDINDRYINVVINYYKGGAGQNAGVAGGVVLLLQDLTKHIHLDNMRKEFVANVSHELRTPLTTIKSYTETLLEEFLEQGESEDSHNVDFLSTIEGEADRMTLLVNDLLELSRLDNKQIEFNFQIFDLLELLRSNVIKHRHALEKKRSEKEIIFEQPEGEMLIYADHERINQVVNNIITNSLRYSGEDAIVEIDIIDKDGFYHVRIMDNGVGIPPEDLNRIFERFYRVDKARSRDLGGTGLGLSISKDIIDAHGGTLTVRSKPDVGTCMTITLAHASLE